MAAAKFMKFAKILLTVVLLTAGSLVNQESIALNPAVDDNNAQVKALPVACGILTYTQDPSALKILFIGNSITYWHDVPRIFAWLMQKNEPGRMTKIAYVVGNNYKLKDHWDAKQALKFIKKEGPWDYVILQDKSGLEYTANSRAPYLKAFIQSIEEEKAKPILFQNYNDHRNQSSDSDRLFSVISKDCRVDLLPIGKIWSCVRNEYPDSLLYDPAGHHPSLAGSYLIAVATYTKLRQKIPYPVSNQLDYQDYRDGSDLIFKTQSAANMFNKSIMNCLRSYALTK